MEFRNYLLSALPKPDLDCLFPFLAETFLERGQTLFQPGDPVEHLYFPSSAIISVVTRMADGHEVESASVGHETAAPLLTALAGERASGHLFAQIGGGALRLPAAVLRERLTESPALADLLMRHAAAIGRQAEQGVACNVLHPAPARLARWLLMTQDRTGARVLPLTQDYMAIMTGVQRTTISGVANHLRELGLIRYSRGNLEVVDRAGLEAESCECYSVVRSAFDALLPKRQGQA